MRGDHHRCQILRQQAWMRQGCTSRQFPSIAGTRLNDTPREEDLGC